MRKDRQKRQMTKGDAAAIGERTDKSECPVIVVGIGASAGGLKSLKKLFAKMAIGHGVAFVIIPHPEPSRENLALKQLRNQTALPVVEAAEGMPVIADRIHVMPSEQFLNINGSRLTIQEPLQCNGLWMPIDHFFCSLAADQRRRACGILLSGPGGDGTLGLSEIKAAGGRTLVEDPEGAEFPQMPQSAFDAGVVDAVLPAEAMAEAILTLAERVKADLRGDPAESPEFNAYLREVLDILRAKVGHDFRCYKPNTLVRRIRRRMTMGRIATFADYARFMHENPDEVVLLQKDLFIGVTEFFRQPQAWETLEEKVIVPLIENARPGSEIRVWVPGCSTGQEAYSLAMLLGERVEKSDKKPGIQIFATDSDVAALTAARNGSYSKEEVGENVTPGRLKRFFARKDGLYQVVKTLRDRVVFAPQNITADPPFSRLDLVSCRNLLIYLDQQAQKKIIALFHFALREGAFLFLGTAETIGDREDLFEPVSKKWRIYRRIGVGRSLGVEIPVRPTGEPQPGPLKMPVAVPPPRVSLTSMVQQMLLDRFAPACVMIDRKLQVVYVHGAVEEYLTFPPGELTTRVVDMAREGLRARLRGAIGKCMETGKPVSVTARVRRGQKSMPVKATVSPLRVPREADGLLLITFEDYPVPVARSHRPAAGEWNVHQLQDELKVTREELQSTIEQLEASNDQLKASNEEVTAANEELQSANEEMETSKEELQSLNEELNTINARLQEKVEELESSNNDIVNLLSSTNIATVFLDKELKVRRYTPASTRLFSLIPSDAGRPIADILRRFTDEALLDDTRRVLADLTPLTKEVQTEDGAWYIRRIAPYRTQDDRIEGVVVTFVDVCDLKATEEALRQRQAELETARTEAENARRRLAVIVDSIADGFFAFDREWRITHINEAALGYYGKKREEVVGRTLFEVFPGVRGSVYETEYRRAMESGVPAHFEAPSTVLDRTWEVHAYPGPDNMTVLLRDVTERNRMAAALREAHDRAEWLARFPEENPNPVMRVSADGSILYCNPAAAKTPGWACKVGETLPNQLLPLVGRAMAEGAEAEQGLELGGKFYSVWVAPSPGESYANVYGRDITERKRAEEALRRYELLSAHTRDIILFMRRDDGHILEANSAATNAYGYSHDELLALSIQDLRLPDTRRLTAEQMAEADTQGILFETVHQRKDGSTFPVEVSSRGATIGGTRTLISVIRDITARKRAELQLFETNQRLQALMQAVPVGVSFSDDATCQRITGNPAVLAQFEVGPEDNLSASAPDAAAPGRQVRFFRDGREVSDSELPLQRAVAGNKVIPPLELEVRLPSGRRWFTEASGAPVRDARGNVIGGLAVTVDITERKRAEEELRKRSLELQQLTERLEERVRERTAELVKSNEMLQTEMAERLRLVAAVEQAGEGIAIMDPAGVIDYVNPAFERITGHGSPKISGKRYGELLRGEMADPDLGKKVQEIIHGGGVWSGRIQQRRRDGQSFELDVALSPIRDRSGAVTNYLAMERDVTQEVRLEQHLRQMQKAEALGTLAGGIAHDFNNILNPIFINTELVLLDAPPGSPMRQPLQMVLEAAERGKGLVKQIITFSRQKEHERRPLKAEPLVKEALKFLRASLPSTVEIREKIQRETGFILADPTQVHQVVMNLCGNAAYAMRERGGVMEVGLAEVEVDAGMARCHPDLNPGSYLRLTVSDTGTGMRKEVMERAFDPFFTTKKPGEGSGMGLSVVHGIVRKGKGAITVFSEAGKGSTFNVFFPRVENEAPSLTISSEPIARGRERILLVDDEEVQVQSIRNMLERLGYAVVARNDSVEALALFRKDPRAFELVITDQTMPQMTGVRLAEELLRIRPDLPVILCTGFSETVDADGVKASGICQFLMKPFSVREMAETIRRALGKK
jgi:two-component system CheB/CheR fusion protein